MPIKKAVFPFSVCIPPPTVKYVFIYILKYSYNNQKKSKEMVKHETAFLFLHLLGPGKNTQHNI